MKYFLPLLLLFTLPSHSQIFEWVQTHQVRYSQNPGLVSSNLCSATNGMNHVARMDSVIILFGQDAFGIVHIDAVDASGNTLRSLQLGSKVTIHDLVTDLDDNLIIAGSFMETLNIDGQDTMQNSGGTLNVDPFLICFDSTGNFRWKRNLNPGILTTLNLSTLSLSPSGKVYYATDDFTDGKITGLDSMGNDDGQIIINGAKTIGDFKFDPFGNIFVTGSTSIGTFSVGTFSINVPEQYMIFIARINPAGQATFVQLAHDVTFQHPNVVTDTDGNAYVAGHLMDTLSWGNFFLQGPDWVYDFFLVKVDSTGNFQWAKEVPNSTGGIVGDFYPASRKCLAYDPAGRILLAGNLRGSIDWGNGVLVNNSTLSQGQLDLVAFDISGLAMWAKNITGNTFTEMHAVVFNDGNWYFSASHNAETGIDFDTVTVDFLHPQNMLLAKLNNNMTTGIPGPDKNAPVLEVFPNPSSGEITLPEQWIGIGSIDVFNSSGQMIKQVKNPSKTIQLTSLSAGLYLLKKNNESIRILLQ